MSVRDEILNQSSVLGGDDWLELRSLKVPEKEIYGYTFSYEKRCNGVVVAFLPYMKTNTGKKYLLRNEAVPCWALNKPVTCCFTGGLEEGLSELQNTLKELKEEAGYIVEEDSDRVTKLGLCFGTKSTNTIYALYAIDVTGLTPIELTVESDLEKHSTNVWVPPEMMSKSSDPIVSICYLRLMNYDVSVS
jgi:hypothetical protein